LTTELRAREVDDGTTCGILDTARRRPHGGSAAIPYRAGSGSGCANRGGLRDLRRLCDRAAVGIGLAEQHASSHAFWAACRSASAPAIAHSARHAAVSQTANRRGPHSQARSGADRQQQAKKTVRRKRRQSSLTFGCTGQSFTTAPRPRAAHRSQGRKQNPESGREQEALGWSAAERDCCAGSHQRRRRHQVAK
jgi:hypothetical protein